MDEAPGQDYWTTLGTNRDIINRIWSLLNLEAFVQVFLYLVDFLGIYMQVSIPYLDAMGYKCKLYGTGVQLAQYIQYTNIAYRLTV